MNKMILGAAGLLLSTSALAAVDLSKAGGVKAMPAAAPVTAKAATGLGTSMIGNAMLIDWNAKNALAAEPASMAIKAMDEPKLLQDAPAKPAESAEMPATETNVAGMSAAETAAKPMASEPMPAESGETPTGSESATKPNLGVGGPDESVAAQSYPACSPGPGDDRCIQLYEPGVRSALATGGLDNGQTGMGGPEEAVDESSAFKSSHEEAAYEPVPEDLVMPASEEELATADSMGEDTLAI